MAAPKKKTKSTSKKKTVAKSAAKKKTSQPKKVAKPKKEEVVMEEEMHDEDVDIGGDDQSMEMKSDDANVSMEESSVPASEDDDIDVGAEGVAEDDLFDDAMLDDVVDFATDDAGDSDAGSGVTFSDEEKVVDSPAPMRKQSHLYRNLALTFLGMSIIVILGIFYITFSEAKIYINATTGTFQEEFSQVVTAEENDLGISLVESEDELSQEFISSREETDIPANATGTAIIINDTDSNQPLVKNTRLQTSEGVLYRLVDATEVPARGQVSVEIYSDKQGKEFEIGPSEFIIPGLPQSLQTLIYAKSESATSGGVEGTSKVTRENIDDARNQVMEKIEEQIKQSINDSLEDGQDILEDSFAMEILEETIDAEVGEEKERFTITIKAKGAVVIGAIEDIEIIARQEIKQKILQDGQELVEFSSDDILYETDSYDAENGELLLNIVASGEGKVRDDASIFDKSKLSGLSPDEAKAYLEGFNGVESARVELGPFWVTRVPYLEDHIDIIFEE